MTVKDLIARIKSGKEQVILADDSVLELYLGNGSPVFAKPKRKKVLDHLRKRNLLDYFEDVILVYRGGLYSMFGITTDYSVYPNEDFAKPETSLFLMHLSGDEKRDGLCIAHPQSLLWVYAALTSEHTPFFTLDNWP